MRGVVRGLSGACVGGLVALELVRYTPLAEWPTFELVSIFGLASYVVLAPLVVLSLLAGERRALVWLLVPVALLGVTYGPLFLPDTPPTGDGLSLRVLTANILMDDGGFDALVSVLDAERPDVVAVQELGVGVAARVPDALRDRYPYQVLHPARDPSGLGILSRYPIVARRGPEPGRVGCRCQMVTLDVAGRAVTVFNVHPPVPTIYSESFGALTVPTGVDSTPTSATVRHLLERVDSTAQPTLVLGDFNVSDRQADYRLVNRRLRDAYREAGWGFGFTFPVGFRYPIESRDGVRLPPFLRIDYVWHDDAWVARTARTGYLPDSDHRYVVADLTLR